MEVLQGLQVPHLLPKPPMRLPNKWQSKGILGIHRIRHIYHHFQQVSFFQIGSVKSGAAIFLPLQMPCLQNEAGIEADSKAGS